MKTGEAGKRLSLDGKTIRNWLAEPAIADMFSAGTKREESGAHRSLNDDDLRILATVRHLRIVQKVYDWEEIREHLETGKRVEPPTLDGISAHTETISRPYAEQGAQLARITAQRDALAARVIEMESRESELHDQIAQLNRQIGKLEALLEIEREKNRDDE